VSSFLIELILLFFVLLIGVPALLVGIWRSLKRQQRYRAARGLCRWVSALWVVAVFVALIALGAAAGPGNWSAMAVLMTIIVFGVAAAPTLVTALVLSSKEFYPDLKK
jgi:hypothetical protein